MSTHGKCAGCEIVWKWEGRLLLREAKCPRCKVPLARTAAILIKDKTKIRIAEPAAGRLLRETKQ